MKLKDYLYDKKYFLVGCVVYILLTEGIMCLFRNKVEEQVFLAGLFCSGIVLYLFSDFRRRSRFLDHVRKTLDGLQEKYLLTEMISEPDYLEGRLMYQNDVEILKSMNDEIARHERLSNEFKSYIETWIHEIKIPIASAGLMLHNMGTGETDATSVRRLKGQLHRIEEDVEQVLYYIRSEVPEKDYVIAGHNLKTIVEEAVRDQKDSLILNRFSVQIDLGDETVRTDKKWLAFMLRQIISNAVKYSGSERGSLHFYVERIQSEEGRDGVRLVAEDKGIGIEEGDLSRIFEKSFTGKNGRNSASTGMGLYICRRLCMELGHGIGAESVPGQYTKIWIGFF